MKKKGRVSGTIGMILSLVLAGGVVAYGTLFNKNAIGKENKPFKSVSTGNFVEGLIQKNGFDETKKLVEDSYKGFKTNTAEKYKSYTLNVTMNESIVSEEAGNKTKYNVLQEAAIYVDENYSYVNIKMTKYEGRNTTIEKSEYIIMKEKAEWYERTDNNLLGNSVNNQQIKDDSQWVKKDGTPMDFSLLVEMKTIFTCVNDNNPVYLNVLGEYFFKNTEAGEGVESECRFTVGQRPVIRVSMKGEKTASGTVVMYYSNLNNTIVNLPVSLKEA